jgi:sugar lactone lactonase YvrE
MKKSLKQLLAKGAGKIGIGGLAVTLMFGAASASSAAVWSPEGRPLIQTYDVAGSGEYDELDGAASEAQFRHPAALLVLGDGTILVADSGNHRIRVIRDGAVSVYAGIPVSLVFDDAGLPAGAHMDGPADTSLFWNPLGLAADWQGNVYVADAANHAVRKISPSGLVTTLAGNGVPGHADGTGSEASFHWPSDVAVDAAGNVYVADTLNHAIRKITPGGKVTTLNALPVNVAEVSYGNFVPAGSFRDGPLSQALFNEPSGLALDSQGNLYVSDAGNQRIRYIDFAEGTVTTVAGGGDLSELSLYVEGAYADGPAAQARFNSPKGIAVDQEGGVYIADSLNHAIRYLKDGRVTTIAGNAAREYGSQNGFDEQALLDYPTDVAVHPNGDLYVADMYNNKIRKIQFYALPDGWTADGTIRVLLNNQQIVFDQPPVIRSGRAMAPLSNLAEAFGSAVAFSGDQIVLSGSGHTLTLTIDKPEVTLRSDDGQRAVTKLDVAPYIHENEIYVPVRHLAELYGIDVDWHAETSTVIVRK